MQVEFTSDFPVSDAACRKATGKTLKEWFAILDGKPDINRQRRDAIRWLFAEIGEGSDPWWSTTIWVEYERAHGIVNRKDGRIEGFNICVTKTIAAPVADVYAAFTDAKLLKKWFGKSTKATVRDKGTFDDGDGNSGEYLRVRENKDVRFTWQNADADAPTLVDVAIADKGKGKSGITLQHQRIQNRKEADGLRRAWTAAFETLKKLLEA